jgi:cytidyltransferase-like protein
MRASGAFTPVHWLEYLDQFDLPDPLSRCICDAEPPDELLMRLTEGPATPPRSDPPVRYSSKLLRATDSPPTRLLGVVSGCYDLLHLGHARAIRYAKDHMASQGGLLCAITLTDASISHIKGSGRPLLTLEERLAHLGALKDLDYLVVAPGRDCLPVLRHLAPAVYFKSPDDMLVPVVRAEAEAVQEQGGTLVLFPPSMPRIMSTTDVIAGLRALPRLRGLAQDDPEIRR